MYLDILPYLRCPHANECQFTLAHASRNEPDGDVIEGSLSCARHGRQYAITKGVVDLLGVMLPPNAAQLVNMLPPAAWGYERLWRYRALTLLTGERFGYDRELALVVGLLAPQRTGLYIDIACSNGLYARAIAQAQTGTPGHVIGIDHSLAMLHQARVFARRAGLRISYVRAHAQALPFGDGAATGVAMGGSLNEIGDAIGAMAEFRRVLAPDGRGVMMSLVRAESIAGRAIQDILAPGGVSFFPLEQHNRLLQDSGMRLAAQWRYRVVVFSLLTH